MQSMRRLEREHGFHFHATIMQNLSLRQDAAAAKNDGDAA